jgi:competence protein ComEA
VTGETPARSRRRLGVGAAVVLVVAALALTVGIGLIRGIGAPVESVPVPGAEDGAGDIGDGAAVASGDRGAGDAAMTEPGLYVHVSGAVAAPGLYRFSDGARVVDAVAAAGGFADGADEASVNLARPIGDGEQLHVPLVGEAVSDPPGTAAGGGAGGAGGGDGRVNLNTADEAALDTLPRIGPALAARIIAWRDENGRFTSVEDLLAVPGIGEKMLESLRDQVTV